jgi:cytochrome c oxidase assembly protein subunit 15
MAVPDWPTTYGYNMFLFPPSQWIGGIFYEHTHRLFASFVGLLTTILAVWLWMAESRAWLRRLGLLAFVLVVAQGVLGGLRVVLFRSQLGIVHASLAQVFLVLLVLIALFTSKWWQADAGTTPAAGLESRRIFTASAALSLLILFQLMLGASMRHQHAGLAVPDFPLAYGKLWPPMDAAAISEINRKRVDSRDFEPVTAFQIGLHMTHRVTACLILAVAAYLAWRARSLAGQGSRTPKLALAWLGVIIVQFGLGVLTVWSNKAADVATAHVMLGALSLVMGALLCAIVCRSAFKVENRMADGQINLSTAHAS